MPIKKRPAGNRKASAIAKDQPESQTNTADWISPTPHVREIYSSSFAPTPKNQIGNFSGTSINIPAPRFRKSMINNRFNPDNDITVVIGVRSPYALINNICANNNQPKYAWENLSLEDCQIAFQKYLTNYKNIVPATNYTPEQFYSLLFDPAYNVSRLFSGMMEQGHPQGGIQPFAIRQNTTCSQAPLWVDSTVPWTQNNTALPAFDGPIQGPADDCWLIAALSAIAWTLPGNLMGDNTCGIFVLDPSVPIDTEMNLDGGYLYPDNFLPVPAGAGSTSTSFWYSYSKYPEMWVSMIERAFGIRKLCTDPNVMDANPTPFQPNICSIGQGAPQYALYVLMGDDGWQQYFNMTMNPLSPKLPQTPKTPQWQNETQLGTTITINPWNTLNGECTPQPGGTFRKTTNPSVTFTYDSGDPLITQNPHTGVTAPPGSGVTYNSDLLVASHSYTVLGTFAESGMNYVVLRNPWGFVKSVTQNNCNPVPNTTVHLANGPLAGFYGPGQPRSLWDGNGNTMDGVFALDSATFSSYFRGFSWI